MARSKGKKVSPLVAHDLFSPSISWEWKKARKEKRRRRSRSLSQKQMKRSSSRSQCATHDLSWKKNEKEGGKRERRSFGAERKKGAATCFLLFRGEEGRKMKGKKFLASSKENHEREVERILHPRSNKKKGGTLSRFISNRRKERTRAFASFLRPT